MITASRYDPDPELKLQAEKLTQLLDNFVKQYGSQTNPNIDLALRLARATVANAERQYAQALELIPESDVKALVERAQGSVQMAETAIQIRADAFLGTGRWSLALTNYASILDLDPNNVRAIEGVANSYLLLGMDQEALTNYNHCVTVAEAQGNDPEIVAFCLNCRGTLEVTHNGFGQAKDDFEHAVRVYDQLTREGRSYRTVDFGTTLNNLAGADMAVGFGQQDSKIALEDFRAASQNCDRASEICKRLVETGDTNDARAAQAIMVGVSVTRSELKQLQAMFAPPPSVNKP
jgi:tetratricopeptide (TPR) repeat protein